LRKDEKIWPKGGEMLVLAGRRGIKISKSRLLSWTGGEK